MSDEKKFLLEKQNEEVERAVLDYIHNGRDNASSVKVFDLLCGDNSIYPRMVYRRYPNIRLEGATAQERFEMYQYFYINAVYKILTKYEPERNKSGLFMIYFWGCIRNRLIDVTREYYKDLFVNPTPLPEDNTYTSEDKKHSNENTDAVNITIGTLKDDIKGKDEDNAPEGIDEELTIVNTVLLCTYYINMIKGMGDNVSGKIENERKYFPLIHLNLVGWVMNMLDRRTDLEKNQKEIFKAYNCDFVDYMYPKKENEAKCRTLQQQNSDVMRIAKKVGKVDVPEKLLGHPYTYPLHDSAYNSYFYDIGTPISNTTIRTHQKNYSEVYKKLTEKEI